MAPKEHVTHDDLKGFMNDTKPIMKQSDVRHVKMPQLDEISTARIFPLFKNDPVLMAYLPSHSSENRLPPHDFFFDILNTLYPEYVYDAKRKALDLRHLDDANNKDQTVLITEEWYKDMMDMPFKSGKKGRMVHLLKQGSKPV